MREFYDISGKIGPLYGPVTPEPEWPMYSYERPAWMLWNAIANELHTAGWSEEKIRDWLQSKSARWALDGDLGDALRDMGKKYAQKHILKS